MLQQLGAGGDGNTQQSWAGMGELEIQASAKETTERTKRTTETPGGRRPAGEKTERQGSLPKKEGGA